MKTYMAHAENVVRKWYVVDAEGMVLGRLASKVASILRGKNKPTFTPNVDTGDFVIVVNCDKVVLTGKKLEKKYYRYHTGHIGGLKEIQYKTLMENKNELQDMNLDDILSEIHDLVDTDLPAVEPDKELQDLLDLGGEARMNFPGTLSDSNWTWRANNAIMSKALAKKILNMTKLYGRYCGK